MANKELSTDEKLVLADVLLKKLKTISDDLKGEEKDNLFDLYDKYGVDRRAIEINGSKVGTVSMTFTKPRIDIKPGSEDLALRYLDACGLTKTVPADKWQESFTVKDNGDIVCLETGEVANELFVLYGSVPKTAMVKVNQKEAIQALRPSLEGVQVARLLEA